MIKKYKRICPNCGKEIFYMHKITCNRANKINSLCRSCGTYKRASKERLGHVEILLENNVESFYWIGFLLADGSFKTKRLCLGLSYKDIEHLKKFGKFIQYKGKYKIGISKLNDKEFKSCGIDVQDSVYVPKIMNKFNIHHNKTKNPPNTILKWDRKLLLALFAGFLDGDGCIIKKTNRSDAKFGIQIHSSWLHILQEFNKIIFDNKCYCEINERGYAVLRSENFPILRKLKLEVLELNIPILKRKWDKINENYINRLERGNILRENILNDLDFGLTRKEIGLKYNVSQALITKVLKYEGRNTNNIQ